MREINVGRLTIALCLAGGFDVLTGRAIAQDPYCGGPMGWGANEVALATVTDAAPRTHFIADRTASRPECPSLQSSCRLKAFLVPGDQVLAGPRTGDFRCATYVSVKSVETNGFLPAHSLTESLPPTPAIADWTGRWVRQYEGSITITAAGDALVVKGHATWGADDAERVRLGAVHIGDIDGSGRPRGNLLAMGEGYQGDGPPAATASDECRVQLRLFGRYLAVDDNGGTGGGCGGANVSFTGVYTRR